MKTRILFLIIAAALAVAIWNINAQSADRISPTPDTWSAATSPPTNVVRGVGVYFPPNGMFYGMGGRTADTAGTDRTTVIEYNPATNAWATKVATYPDNQVNNMACGVLTDAGTPYIYCVGGSAAAATTSTSRVFRYNPAADAFSAIAAPWPGNVAGNILPGGVAVFQNKLYIIGGFQINTAMINQIWEFTPGTNAWVQKTAVLPVPLGYVPATAIGNFIYTGGGSTFTPPNVLADSTNSFKYDPVLDSISAIAAIPRATGETRAVAVNTQMWVLGGGRTVPNPSTQVDVFNPGTNTWSVGQPFATARRNFLADTDGTRVWIAGGYDSTGTGFVATAERFLAPVATSAVSRKAHGGPTFDINLPQTGNVGIECRNTAGNHTLIVTFPTAVTISGAQVITGTGMVGSAVAAGAEVTVNLTGVTNAQRLTVLINNVNDGTNTGNVAITLGILAGDTNGNGSVNAGDTSQTKAQIGNPISAANFRNDVNASGGISASDVSAVKGNSGTALPP